MEWLAAMSTHSHEEDTNTQSPDSCLDVNLCLQALTEFALRSHQVITLPMLAVTVAWQSAPAK